MSTQLQLKNNRAEDHPRIELIPHRNSHAEISTGPAPGIGDSIPDVPCLRPNADWRVAQVKDFIDKRDGQLGTALEHLTRQLDTGISASHLSRLFRQEVGLGVREYSKRMRMRAAVQKLTSTTLPIKHIAADLGYCSPADFFRQFKHAFKMTPVKFRMLQRRKRDFHPGAE